MPPSSATAGGGAAPSRSLLLLLLLLLAGPSVARSRHTISLTTSALRPNTLAWDPTAQHFLIASSDHPTVSSVSDAGVVSPLLSSPNSSITSLAVDPARRRLLLALAGPAAVAAYDLRSPRPHRLIFSSPLPDPSAVPGGIAVDAHKGDAFVTGDGRIWKIDAEGAASVLSESRGFGGALDGVAHVRKGFLLAVQRSTGRVFKVDEEDGAARAVLAPAAAEGAPAVAVAVTSDGAAVVAGGGRVRVMRSSDGWSEAAVHDEAGVGEGEAAGVAVREGRRAYVMVLSEEGKGIMGSRIEEVEFEREREGDMVWGMVLVGLGMAYFLYWRFQMGKLVTSMNKKRA